MALLHPLIFARSKVLACKGGDGDAHGVHDHPEQSVHLSVNGPGRNDVGSEAVDVGLDQMCIRDRAWWSMGSSATRPWW